MYSINKPKNQYLLAGLFLGFTLIQTTTGFAPGLDFLSGLAAGTGVGLLVAAFFGLKVFPEKNTG